MRGAGVAELADTQDLGWAQTRPRDELKALSFASHGAFYYLSGIVWADRSTLVFDKFPLPFDARRRSTRIPVRRLLSKSPPRFYSTRGATYRRRLGCLDRHSSLASRSSFHHSSLPRDSKQRRRASRPKRISSTSLINRSLVRRDSKPPSLSPITGSLR
jgi:hypothetical protein